MIFIYVEIIHNDVDDNVKAIHQCISHENKSTPFYLRFVTSLKYFECHPNGIFKGLGQPQELESVSPTTFVASAGFRGIIKGLFPS